MRLLVLRVIAWVDCSQNELYHPEIGRQVDWRNSSRHLGRLVLVVGRAVYFSANLWIVIELGQEFSSLLIVANLRKLKGHSTSTVLRSLSGLNGILHCLYQSVLVLAGWLTISDADNQQRLLHLTAVQLLHQDGVDDLLAQFGSERSQTLVPLACQNLLDLLLATDVGHLLQWEILVHEAEIDSVIIEKRCCKACSLQNKLQVFDTLAILLEGHGSRVINVNHHIV